MRSFMSALVIALSILVSTAAVSAQSYQKHFPLKEGNRWSYEGDYPGPALAAQTISVDGKLWSSVYHLTQFPGFPQGLWVGFAGNTLYAWDSGSGDWVKFLRFGASSGTTYTVTLPQAGWWDVPVTVKSKSAKVADPYLDATYSNCVHFKVGAADLYFAKNVGLVRWTTPSIAGLLRSAEVAGKRIGKGLFAPGARIDDRWLLGVNYPWVHYGNDFGANAWGAYGVHAGGSYASQMVDMKARGVRVVRWFVFTDLRGGALFDANGTPTGPDSWAIQDLEAALDLAKAHDLHLIPVLFDFGMMMTSKWVNGVQTGGRSDLIKDPNKTKALVDKVIVPVLKKFARHPNILAWEVMNEPEWGISDVPEPKLMNGMVPVTMAQFWNFSSQVSAAIHAVAGAHSTVGSASLGWVKLWSNGFAASKGLPPLNLDFYQIHYYPHMASGKWTNHPVYGTLSWSPLKQSVGALGLDRPVLVGEIQMDSAGWATLDKLFANGYAGALPWAYAKDFGVDWAGFTPWGQAHSDIVSLP